jgi:dihydroorotase
MQNPPSFAEETSLKEQTKIEPLFSQFDIVIKNGRVINPETLLDKEGLNIGILNGKIVELNTSPLKGKKEIDATGLIVAPGFIDILSYDPNQIGVWNKIADGVTTNLAMHGGSSNPKEWYLHYERQNLPLNFGTSFFYTGARNKLNISIFRSANEKEIKKLALMAKRAIKEGALGISFSLEYVPGISPEEILTMMKIAKECNVPVFFHLRYSDMEKPGTNIDAINEVTDYAKQTRASVHIDHINSTGGTFSMKKSLKLIEEARSEGSDITACVYPYNFWGTYLNSTRFSHGWQNRFHISYRDLQIAGSKERLTEKSFKKYALENKVAIAYAIPERDVITALRSPYVIIASDAILEKGYNNHPRASGTFARTIKLYSREKKIISLMDAISKMTLLPAKLLEKASKDFRKKGRISVGSDADITIFNYKTISDKSTVEHPEYQSSGIEYVIVNGFIVKDPEGFKKGIAAGRKIKSNLSSVHSILPSLINSLLKLYKSYASRLTPISSYKNFSIHTYIPLPA